MDIDKKTYYDKMRKVSPNLFIAVGDILQSQEQYLVHNCMCFG